MRLGKKAKPFAACSVCQALTSQRGDLNHRCGKVVNGRRCWGTYKSAVTFLWDPCESCEATGRVGTQVCGECAGFGWKLYG